jgi:HEAT repeats
MNPIRFKWKTQCYPATSILAGLVTSQVIATFQVFLANRSLYDTLTAMDAAGYLTVPNHNTMCRLQEVTTAICGGLFLTLSVGAGVSVLSFAAAWLWDRVCRRKTIFLVPLLLLWAGLSSAVNWNGFSPVTILYFTVIPPVVFTVALGWMPHVNNKRPWRNGLWHLIPIIVLGLLWAPQMKNGLFINIRDHLLLGNPMGERIVAFYYRYTLYPAEILKPLEQKLLKTCNLEAIAEGPRKQELRKTLLIHDWIETETLEHVDMVLSSSGDMLLLRNGNHLGLTIPKKEFLSRPANALKRFSSRVDKHGIFRKFTFYSLLFGFPITLYIFVYSLLSFFMGRWIENGKSAILSTSLCFSMGLMLLLPFGKSNVQPTDLEYLSRMLESENRHARLTALKRIREDHLDLSVFSAYKTILRSPHTAERYWLAKSISFSKSHRTHEDLLNLLEDPSPMVVSAALFSLGRRGEKKALPKILKWIKTSDHVYVQWYAYKSLKALGWKQNNKAS